MANVLYNTAMEYIAKGSVNFATHSFMYAVLTAGYTPAASHGVWADLSSGETAGAGYTGGGQLMTGLSVNLSQGSNYVYIDANNVVISNSSINGRYGVIYDTTQVSDAVVCLQDYTTSYTSSNGNFSVAFANTGFLLMSQP